MIADVTADCVAFLDAALREDLGQAGDVTSIAIFGENDRAEAVIRNKAAGVVSGTVLLKPLFSRIDPALDVQVLVGDGDRLPARTEIARLSGSVRAILAGERTALNLLQRLSGIATATAELVSLIAHTRAKLLDTRKTTPTLRLLEKKAVVDGGGMNHRFGLYDMILIKDTHVKAAGGVGNAIRKAQAFAASRPGLRIEAEVQTFDEFAEACSCAPHRIMLDNMDLALMKRCVTHARQAGLPVELETSGNVGRDTIAAIAETGVDFISAGCITHSARALDIHLVIV